MSHNKSFKPQASLGSGDDVLINFNERLGDWAHGSVYKGYSKSLSKRVMVKVIDLNKFPLPPAFIDDEILILKKLHENSYITKLIEEKCYDNTRTIVTEICDQGTLRTLLDQSGPLPEAKALRILLQIVKGLNEVHKNKFSHGSLCPENIFLFKDPDSDALESIAKVANFTFARHYSSGPLEREHLPEDIKYIAPEVLKTLRYYPKSDIWSLGLIYYEMLYGALPYLGNTRKELEASFISTQLDFPPEKDISEASIMFLQRCLERNTLRRLEWSDLMPHRPTFMELFGNNVGIYSATNPGGLLSLAKKVVNKATKKDGKRLLGHAHSRSMNLSRIQSCTKLNQTAQADDKQQANTMQELCGSIPRSYTDLMDSSAIDRIENASKVSKEGMLLTEICSISELPLAPRTSIPEEKEEKEGKSKNTKIFSKIVLNRPDSVSLRTETCQSPITQLLSGPTNNYYTSLMSKVGTSEDYHRAKMNASRSGSISCANNSFSLPFKWLSYKAEILGEIYQLANKNKDHPLYDQIMRILEAEVSKLNIGMDRAAESGERLHTEINDLTKRRNTAVEMEGQQQAKQQQGKATVNLKGVNKQSLVKKEKSKEIYALLKEMLATLMTHGKKTVNSEDIVKIAANFKVFREYEEIGDNAVRDLESLKDIMLVFYRKKHYDHLKYLLLVKNLV